MTTSDQQSIKDTAYIKAYRTWVASLSPEAREALVAQQIDAPDVSRKTSTSSQNETILRWAKSPSPTPRDELESETKEIDVASGGDAASAIIVADALASFCARIRAHPNPLLAIDTLCFATGLMGVEGHSQAELAKRHRVTRAAFSKHVVMWIDLFQLRPPRGCRSLRTRRAYSLARKASLGREDEYASG